jgi:uncharacterized repeat protein (TIGR01451 family)
MVIAWVRLRQMQRAAFGVLCAAILYCGFAVSPVFAQTVITYENTVNAPITDAGTSCSLALTRTFFVPEVYTIADINVGVLLSHTRRNNLVISLTSPAGTTVTLFRNTGGTRSNLNVLLDSAFTTSINTHTTANDTANNSVVVPPYQRNFSPLQNLSAFNGQNANGTWTLTICDNVTGNSGTFFHANLFITPLRATLSVSKASSVLFDGLSGINPKSLPGARVRYCITITNDGPGLVTAIVGTDAIPANTVYVPNSLRSGVTCTSTLTAEDDDASGADETDPHGASFLGSSIVVSATSMPNADSFAVAFLVTLN